MPKPMLKQPRMREQTNNILSAAYQQEQKEESAQMDKMKLDRLLRKPRSKKYMDALNKLDAGGHTHNQSQVKEIIEEHEKLGASVIGVEKVDWKDVPKYGTVSGEAINDRLYKVEKMQEKPKVEETKSNLAISDRHVLMPDLFDFLANTKPGKGGEIQVTDAYNSMVNTKEGVYAYDYEATRFDSGDKLGFVKASVDETLRRPELRDEMNKFLKSLDI